MVTAFDGSNSEKRDEPALIINLDGAELSIKLVTLKQLIEEDQAVQEVILSKIMKFYPAKAAPAYWRPWDPPAQQPLPDYVPARGPSDYPPAPTPMCDDPNKWVIGPNIIKQNPSVDHLVRYPGYFTYTGTCPQPTN